MREKEREEEKNRKGGRVRSKGLNVVKPKRGEWLKERKRDNQAYILEVECNTWTVGNPLSQLTIDCTVYSI